MEHPSKADSYRCFEQFKSLNYKKVFKKGFIGIAKSLGMCLLDGGYAVLKIDIKCISSCKMSYTPQSKGRAYPALAGAQGL